VQGRKQGTMQGTGHESLWGTVCFFDNVRHIRRSFSRGTPQFVVGTLGPLSGEAEMILQAKPAELVENDPERKSSKASQDHFAGAYFSFPRSGLRA